MSNVTNMNDIRKARLEAVTVHFQELFSKDMSLAVFNIEAIDILHEDHPVASEVPKDSANFCIRDKFLLACIRAFSKVNGGSYDSKVNFRVGTALDSVTVDDLVELILSRYKD